MLVLAAVSAAASFYFLPASSAAKPAGEGLESLPFGAKIGICAFAGGAIGMLAPSFWLSAKVCKRQQLLRSSPWPTPWICWFCALKEA